jgi:hypothetical protein
MNTSRKFWYQTRRGSDSYGPDGRIAVVRFT